MFAVVLLWLGVFSSFSAAQTGEPSLDSYIESLRADVRADHVAIINQAMQFNDQESKAFWPCTGNTKPMSESLMISDWP